MKLARVLRPILREAKEAKSQRQDRRSIASGASTKYEYVCVCEDVMYMCGWVMIFVLSGSSVV